MQIVGEWFVCSDGVGRPTVRGKVQAADGSLQATRFLIDSGADCTVFSAELLGRLQWAGHPGPAGVALQGIGGGNAYVVVTTLVELTADDGTPAHIRGIYAAFTDPAATDLSILGRDVLNNFDLILSRPRNEILILAGNHQYIVQKP